MSLAQALAEAQEYRKYNKLYYYEPYPFQRAFHHAQGGEVYATGGFDFKLKELPARIRGLMAGNQVGKTLSAGHETAMHLTGEYPDWWKGHRFDHPIRATVCGVINDKTRDICQKELFGEPGIREEFGTGAVPKDLIGETTPKPGVPKAFDNVLVRHKSGGWSKVFFGSYNQDLESLMGTRMHFIWGDEEPPKDVHSQFLRSTLSTKGKIIYSFTPENGQTELVFEFLEDLKPNMALVQATWDDAPHFDDPEYRHEAEMQFPLHEREMRRMGIPKMGTGMVWPVLEEDFTVKGVKIEHHWPKLCAIDFGIDHPFAAVWLAWDRDTDIVYVYDCFRQSRNTIATNASAIKKKGQWIPVIWPHDMEQDDPKSCTPLAQLFRDEGVNMRQEKFSNPPGPGQKEGQGGIGVEVGITHIYERMQTGTFKVLSHLHDWFTEFRGYHRDKNGKIVKLRDDLMAATRYGVQSLRFAHTEPVIRKKTTQIRGSRNW